VEEAEKERVEAVKVAVGKVHVGLLPSSIRLRACHRSLLLELAAVLENLATGKTNVATKNTGGAKKTTKATKKAAAGETVGEGIATADAARMAARRVVVPRSTKAPTTPTAAKPATEELWRKNFGMKETTKTLLKTPSGAVETKPALLAIPEEDCSDSGPEARQAAPGPGVAAEVAKAAAEEMPRGDPVEPEPADSVGEERLSDWLTQVLAKLEHPATRAHPTKFTTLMGLATRLQTKLLVVRAAQPPGPQQAPDAVRNEAPLQTPEEVVAEREFQALEAELAAMTPEQLAELDELEEDQPADPGDARNQHVEPIDGHAMPEPLGSGVILEPSASQDPATRTFGCFGAPFRFASVGAFSARGGTGPKTEADTVLEFVADGRPWNSWSSVANKTPFEQTAPAAAFALGAVAKSPPSPQPTSRRGKPRAKHKAGTEPALPAVVLSFAAAAPPPAASVAMPAFTFSHKGSRPALQERSPNSPAGPLFKFGGGTTSLGQSEAAKAFRRLFELRASSSIEPQALCDQDSNDTPARAQDQAAAMPAAAEPLLVNAGAVRASAKASPAAAAVHWVSRHGRPAWITQLGQPAAASA
jgi:hypothetical protein